MKKGVKRLVAAVLVAALAFPLFSGFWGQPVYASEAQAGLPAENAGAFVRAAYVDYLAQHAGAARPDVVVDVDVFASRQSAEAEPSNDVAGWPALLTFEGGFVEWAVTIPEAGFYNIYVEYYPLPGRGIDVERTLLINGQMPFAGADTVTFARAWTDAGPIRQDNRGNDIRPAQAEAPRWDGNYLMDSLGYVTEPYQFYFNQGVNTLRLDSLNESMAIRRLTVKNKERPPSYAQLLAASGYLGEAPKGYLQVMEGEWAQYRSAPTLYATYDRSSPGTRAYSVDTVRLNMIGGLQWRTPGQWIEWEIDVPEDGLYNLTFKARQNYNRGNVSVRRLTIDGLPPFLEAEEIDFAFTGDWQNTTLSDEKGEPYLFPLTKGRHALRLEVTLGGMGEFLSETEQIVNRLTAVYRRLLVLIGTTPDPNRDYQVHIVFPDVMDYFREEAAVLRSLVERVTAYTGQRGAQIAVAQTLATKLERFANRPEIIPRSLDSLKTDIGAMAAFILRMSESPLDIDQIFISAPGVALPPEGTGFFARVLHELRSFWVSFFVDYSSIGSVFGNDTRTIDVWILSSRDHAQSLKAIIDETFTPEYQIGVNLRIIAGNVLLPAVVAGTGPDVALSVPSGDPVNFALRGSAVDVSQMPGFNELKQEFFESSFVPFMHAGGVFALPETQGFPVLFYRRDILNELGLSVPETWDDIIRALPVLQKNNMDFGLATDDLMSMYGMFLNMLYQRGGEVYSEDFSRTLLDYSVSVDAFEFITSLYTQYRLPKIFVFTDRFRTGEMPMGISDYGMFNHLSVSAPEIRGLWNFTVMPGIVNEYGEIDRSSTGGGTASMIMPQAKDMDAAWTFLKWWVSAETQARFGRELESIIGAAARHNTANVRAFEQLAWSAAQRDVIMRQWEWVVGTPEVPGGYYTGRHMLNALRRVMNNNEEPRETLLDYTRTINDELTKKRIEFGLQ